MENAWSGPSCCSWRVSDLWLYKYGQFSWWKFGVIHWFFIHRIHSSHYRYATESKILNCLELCIPLDNLMYVDALMLHKKTTEHDEQKISLSKSHFCNVFQNLLFTKNALHNKHKSWCTIYEIKQYCKYVMYFWTWKSLKHISLHITLMLVELWNFLCFKKYYFIKTWKKKKCQCEN